MRTWSSSSKCPTLVCDDDDGDDDDTDDEDGDDDDRDDDDNVRHDGDSYDDADVFDDAQATQCCMQLSHPHLSFSHQRL